MENQNKALIVGTVASKEVAFVGTKHGYDETFYELQVEVARTSGTKDMVPVVCSEKYLYDTVADVGARVRVEGSVHTVRRTREDNVKYHTMYVYVTKIDLTEETEDVNDIQIEGTVFKFPRSRITAETQRSITDFTLVLTRANDRKDFIPCIAWGRNATLAGKRKEGDVINLLGRFQSRQKQLKGSDTVVTRHEISVINMEVIKKEENKPVTVEEEQQQPTEPVETMAVTEEGTQE